MRDGPAMLGAFAGAVAAVVALQFQVGLFAFGIEGKGTDVLAGTVTASTGAASFIKHDTKSFRTTALR